MSKLKLHDVFSQDGLLSQELTNYHPRSVQIELAARIEKAIKDKASLVAEAGTGTGKSFAYLIPVLLSGKKALVSTGTKNLQDQLYFSDIPILRKVLKLPFKAVILKGRANYLCPYRMENAIAGDLTFGKEQARHLTQIQNWSEKTQRGDTAELSQVPESSPVWGLVTSTSDNCLGQECPKLSSCHLLKARQDALDADLVIINHHLLCADWLLRDEGFGELLPDVECIVVDEAHQLANTASQFLGISVSSRRVNGFIEDTRVELEKIASDMPAIHDSLDELSDGVAHLRTVFANQQGRFPLQSMEGSNAFAEGIANLENIFEKLVSQLDAVSERSRGLDQCWRRSDELYCNLSQVTDLADGKWICWFEVFKSSFILHRTPLEIADEFASFLKQSNTSWIYTSATLTVAESFDHFINSLGLINADCQRWESPFDYAANSLFYHPRGLPLPHEPGFTESIVEFALPVLRFSRGRAFFLFTSHKAMQVAAGIIEQNIDYPVLVQGSEPKTKLLKRFQQLGNAILLGTGSFWEGVDVRGEALSCVIIDKLPFVAPGDPVISAKLEAIRKRGDDPFNSYQLPQAVITLNQGIGRLIRDVTDRGVLMVCDPRLLKKRYGQVFLDSVPAMRRTRELKDVADFFSDEAEDTAR